MNSACPKELATEFLSDSDHSTKVAPSTLKGNKDIGYIQGYSKIVTFLAVLFPSEI